VAHGPPCLPINAQATRFLLDVAQLSTFAPRFDVSRRIPDDLLSGFDATGAVTGICLASE
jgi:hypothetical protein